MYDKIFWILSDGRSGSTWLSQVLNFRNDAHVEIEPVHCDFNPRLKAEPLIPFPDAAKLDALYVPLFRDIAAGQFTTNRLNDFRANARNLVIKDINAIFIAPGVLNRMPEIEPIMLVRHPVDVAKSKISLPKWNWFTDVEKFLTHEQIAGSIRGLEAQVLGANTPFKRHVINWAVGYRYFFDAAIERPFQLLRYPVGSPDLMKIIGDKLGLDIAGSTDLRQAFVDTSERRSMTDAPRWSPLHKRIYDRFTKPSPRQIANDKAYAEDMIDAFGLRWIFQDSAAKTVPLIGLAPAKQPLAATL